uniref:RNA polymerase sigma-54 factor n=1 Tax=candidate division WOR-3 bacterium TaxID=2052148 RepID=A0A7C3J6Q8_UNCW3
MKQKLETSLRQEIKLTPQLLTLVKILQLPLLELQQVITNEIEQNPFLTDDILEEEDVSYEEVEPELPLKDEIDYEYFFHDEWKKASLPSERYNREDEEFDPISNVEEPENLQDYLLTQSHIFFDDPDEIKIAEEITFSLSDDGLLEISLSELAENLKLPLEKVEYVHSKYKFFEPVGIGSRSVQEVLLTQLENQKKEETLEYRIIKEFYEEFLTNKLYIIENKLKITRSKLEKALESIKSLNPKPANGVWGKSTDYIIPDVIVEQRGEELYVSLNLQSFPEVHLSKSYFDMYKNKENLSQEEKRFLKNKFNAALFLLEGIYRRNNTLLKISERIIAVQKDFFFNGISSLKPLTLSDIAGHIGMHEATVSRAIENKYMDTPSGIFPLKFFFSKGVKNNSGFEVSNKNIMNIIKEEIEKEDPNNPYSDLDLVKILEEKYSIKIARRTVAKYRENLNILPSSKRKGTLRR